MKCIVTNDDGIEAPGIAVLARILENFGTPVIIAPEVEQSGVGHRVTSRTPLRVNTVGENRFSINGTPADCVRLGLKHLAGDAGWVFSGINPGANLGSDVYNSGTVAAAREAAILGRPAVAVSQYIARNHKIDWEITSVHAERVIRTLLERKLPPGYFWNVNLPHPLTQENHPETVFCGLDINPHDYRYREEEDGFVYEGIIHDRPRREGRDVAVCFGGSISVTRIAIGTLGLT